MLPECRLSGIGEADVVLTNFSKAMMVGNTGTLMFVRDRARLN
jgi:aromatic-L-amino-acid decarboxylase